MRRLAAAVLMGAVVSSAPAVGQDNGLGQPRLAQGNILRVSISAGGDTAVSENLDLALGSSAIVELPIDVADALISNPAVADAVIRTPRRIFILGLEVGTTNAFFFNDDGEQILNLQISVQRDVSGIQDMVDRLLPDSRVTVEALGDNVHVRGTVPSAAAADQVIQIAVRAVDTPEQVLNSLSISGGEQVLLKVRIVEMQRTVVKQLGINLNGTTNFGEFTPDVTIPYLDENGNPVPGVVQVIRDGYFDNTSTIGTNNEFALAGRSLGGLGVGLGYQNLVGETVQSTIGATLSALERVGLVRTLAEPNLTAISGEAANFLAGGEFPVPAGRDASGNISIEYKPFGVGLSFTPVVLDDGRISLFVSTEVSELTDQGALELSSGTTVDPDTGEVINVPGLVLPGLKVRRAETTLELPSGGSMVMAGLIQDQTAQNVDGTPGAMNVPGLGALFRARDLESAETELVVIVTPYLVSATSEDALSTPSDGYQTANDWSGFLLGRLNRVYASPDFEGEGRGWRGPIGFILDEGE
ncbi:MAG: type II and III secretion system protein family protein [Maricaulaceae bacterium]|jgi:pilus assembly protein CpaC